MKRKPESVRCLIAEITKVAARELYSVQVLQADSANLATNTGIASTIFMTREQINEALKMHQLRSVKKLFGAPVICRVTYNTGNMLGCSSFLKNTY